MTLHMANTLQLLPYLSLVFLALTTPKEKKLSDCRPGKAVIGSCGDDIATHGKNHNH